MVKCTAPNCDSVLLVISNIYSTSSVLKSQTPSITHPSSMVSQKHKSQYLGEIDRTFNYNLGNLYIFPTHFPTSHHFIKKSYKIISPRSDMQIIIIMIIKINFENNSKKCYRYCIGRHEVSLVCWHTCTITIYQIFFSHIYWTSKMTSVNKTEFSSLLRHKKT